MRTLKQFLDTYAESHQNPLNQWIHMVCVPAIFFATLGLMWLVPVGRFLPFVPAGAAPYFNLATAFAVLVGLPFYLRLSFGSLLTGTAWSLLSFAGIVAIQSHGLSLGWICGGIWVAAWAVQFYGHHVEGAKPSFADDIQFLMIGPLFVMEKIRRLVTTGSIHPPTH
ncbi:MAG TPA: Mpo1-like protein [Stenotrophobium sp.]|nr:Mpo1-like protein [Stenotrophobium sp.]